MAEPGAEGQPAAVTDHSQGPTAARPWTSSSSDRGGDGGVKEGRSRAQEGVGKAGDGGGEARSRRATAPTKLAPSRPGPAGVGAFGALSGLSLGGIAHKLRELKRRGQEGDEEEQDADYLFLNEEP